MLIPPTRLGLFRISLVWLQIADFGVARLGSGFVLSGSCFDLLGIISVRPFFIPLIFLEYRSPMLFIFYLIFLKQGFSYLLVIMELLMTFT